jgi:hypothetical protein
VLSLRWPRDAEGQLRLLLHAYPVAWREQRAEELIGTVAELLGENGRVGWSLAVNIVLSGWRTRLREHPPLRLWLAYLLFDRRLPARWRPWVRQEILGRFLLLRRSLLNLSYVVIIFAVMQLAVTGELGLPWYLLPGWFAGTLFGSRLAGHRVRRRLLRRHGLDRDADLVEQPIPAWPTYAFKVRPRRVRQVWPWLVAGGTAGVLLAVPWQLILLRLAPTLSYVPPDYSGTHALPGYEWKMRLATAVCAAISVVVAAVAGLRLRRRLLARSGVNRAVSTPVNRWFLAAVVGTATLVWGGLAVLRDHSTAREPYSLVVHCLVLLIAPASVVIGLIARQAEKSGGLTVNWRDVVLGTFGIDAIPDCAPEQRLVGVLDPELA